jgi:hypothetical protein
MNNEFRSNWGKGNPPDWKKAPLGRSCYENWNTPADPTISGPQPLSPGNFELSKLSSPRGSSNRVSPSFQTSTHRFRTYDSAGHPAGTRWPPGYGVIPTSARPDAVAPVVQACARRRFFRIPRPASTAYLTALCPSALSSPIKPNNPDLASGTESPRSNACTEYPRPHPDPQLSAPPLISGHAPAPKAQAASLHSPAISPHPH